MSHPVFYHGSGRKLNGDFLVPCQGHSADGNDRFCQRGVYATQYKNSALTMAILKSSGVRMSSLDFDGVSKGVIYKGWPEQEFVFLYTLPPEGFVQLSKGQFISYDKVKPLSIETVRVEDHLEFVRQASSVERESFLSMIRGG